MTDKQNAFVTEYLKDMNLTQAAIRAGYSPKTAYSIGQRLMKNVEVSNAINSAMSERQQRTEITVDYVIDNLREIVDRTMQKKPVIVKGEQLTDENGLGVWCFDAKNAIKALELLGKHLNMFTDKIQANIKSDMPTTLAELMLADFEELQRG